MTSKTERVDIDDVEAFVEDERNNKGTLQGPTARPAGLHCRIKAPYTPLTRDINVTGSPQRVHQRRARGRKRQIQAQDPPTTVLALTLEGAIKAQTAPNGILESTIKAHTPLQEAINRPQRG